MKISTEDGTITFAAGPIGPSLDRNRFLSSPIGSGAEEFVMNEPHATYRIFPEKGIVVTAQFTGELLETVGILFQMQDDSDENWSEAHERERKMLHDAWLLEEIGPPPYRYPWGRLVSSYDPKACESEILVSFGNRPTPKRWWQKAQQT
jgi:hypothetical protein